MSSRKKGYSIFLFLGAMLWIVAGIIMSLREPGNEQGKYRMTYDLMPLLGAGMLLITFSLAHLLWFYRRNGDMFLTIVCVLNILAGVIFLTGGLMVAANPKPFPFVLFSGYMTSLLALILSGITGVKRRLFSSTVAYSIISMGALLLFFNDQYSPWMAIVFGGVALWLSYLFFFQLHHFSSRFINNKV